MALAATKSLLARCPVGVTMLEAPIDPESAYTRSIQAEMHTAGIVPFSGSMLVGQLGPVTTVVAGSPSKEVMAVARIPASQPVQPYQKYAWGGLVSVVERHRGKGLGTTSTPAWWPLHSTAWVRRTYTSSYRLRISRRAGWSSPAGFVTSQASFVRSRPESTALVLRADAVLRSRFGDGSKSRSAFSAD